MSNQGEPVVRQEPDAIDRRRLRRAIAVGVMGFAIAIAVTVLFLRTAPPQAAAPPPAPAQADTSLVLATERGVTLKRAQRASLERFGWVDRDAGIARIPIERAMDIVADPIRNGHDGDARP
jgi:hypothetical protein